MECALDLLVDHNLRRLFRDLASFIYGKAVVADCYGSGLIEKEPGCHDRILILGKSDLMIRLILSLFAKIIVGYL